MTVSGLDWSTIITAVLGVLSASAAGLVGFLGGKRQRLAETNKTVAETEKIVTEAIASVQDTINESFTLYVKELQTERIELKKEMADLKLEVRLLNAHIEDLRGELFKHGLKPPERPRIVGGTITP